MVKKLKKIVKRLTTITVDNYDLSDECDSTRSSTIIPESGTLSSKCKARELLVTELKWY